MDHHGSTSGIADTAAAGLGSGWCNVPFQPTMPTTVYHTVQHPSHTAPHHTAPYRAMPDQTYLSLYQVWLNYKQTLVGRGGWGGEGGGGQTGEKGLNTQRRKPPPPNTNDELARKYDRSRAESCQKPSKSMFRLACAPLVWHQQGQYLVTTRHSTGTAVATVAPGADANSLKHKFIMRCGHHAC